MAVGARCRGGSGGMQQGAGVRQRGMAVSRGERKEALSGSRVSVPIDSHCHSPYRSEALVRLPCCRTSGPVGRCHRATARQRTCTPLRQHLLCSLRPLYSPARPQTRMCRHVHAPALLPVAPWSICSHGSFSCGGGTTLTGIEGRAGAVVVHGVLLRVHLDAQAEVRQLCNVAAGP